MGFVWFITHVFLCLESPCLSVLSLLWECAILHHLGISLYCLEKTLILGKLKAGGEEDDRGRDGWMVSLTQWTWVWASSGRWWRTGRWCHWLSGHEFEQALGDGEGQGDCVTDSVDMSLSKLWEMVKDREAWVTEQQWQLHFPVPLKPSAFWNCVGKMGSVWFIIHVFLCLESPRLSVLPLLWGCVIVHHLGVSLYCFLCYCGVILLNSTTVFLSLWHSEKERRKRNLFLTFYFLLQSSQFRGRIYSRPVLMQWAHFTPRICAPSHTVVQSLPRLWSPVCILHWLTPFGLFQGFSPLPPFKNLSNYLCIYF